MPQKIKKNTISANKCVIGETYYLTGMWWDYGNLLHNVPLVAIGLVPKEKTQGATCLLNTPVKFNGRVPAKKSIMGVRKSYEFELENGSKVYADANSDSFFLFPI